MKINDAIKEAAKELNLPYDVCYKAYMSSWEFINEKMQELPLREELTEEQFKQLRPNFNMPELGKFAVTWEKYQKVKRRFKYINNLKSIKENDSKDKGD